MRLIPYLPFSVLLLTTGALAQTYEQGNRPLDHIAERIRESHSIYQEVDVRGARVTLADKLLAAGILIFDSSKVLESWPEYLYKVESTEFGNLCDNEALRNVSLGMVAAIGDGWIDPEHTESFEAQGVALPPAPPNDPLSQNTSAISPTDPGTSNLEVRDLCHWVGPTLSVMAQGTHNSPLYVVTDQVIPSQDMKFIGHARVDAARSFVMQ